MIEGNTPALIKIQILSTQYLKRAFDQNYVCDRLQVPSQMKWCFVAKVIIKQTTKPDH